MKKDWKVIVCFSCRGYGIVASYSSIDFEGADECNSCRGTGRHYIKPSGKLFLYPGGPITGNYGSDTYLKTEVQV